MRYFLYLCVCLPVWLSAQSASEADVANVLTTLFDGMRAADTVAVAAVFYPNARLMSVDTRGAQPKLTETPIPLFVTSIGGAQPGDLEERILHTEIRVDGDLATAWTEYTFVYKGQVSHCGVNAFQLARSAAEGWRILQITDTRHKEDCRATAPAATVAIDSLVDQWHHAAAVADADGFFGRMTADGIYIGTDASERWLRDELRAWAAAAFARESAWAFTAHDRTIYFSADQRTAWWEELLDTWMGTCRGSGVATRQTDGSWLISHYHLAVAVPNDKVQDYLKLLDKN